MDHNMIAAIMLGGLAIACAVMSKRSIQRQR